LVELGQRGRKVELKHCRVRGVSPVVDFVDFEVAPVAILRLTARQGACAVAHVRLRACQAVVGGTVVETSGDRPVAHAGAVRLADLNRRAGCFAEGGPADLTDAGKAARVVARVCLSACLSSTHTDSLCVSVE
jgi:hypothetical protein